MLVAVHAVATFAMVGLIWFVQVVHYPLMAAVGPPGFVDYEREHVRRTGWVVGPLMLLEAGSATLLLWTRPGPASWAGVALLALIWGSTALVQVPLHHRLSVARDEQALRHLVRSNWLRTIAWSARGAVALGLLVV